MDTGLSSASDYQQDNQLNPFGDVISIDEIGAQNQLMAARGNSCQMGAEIVLKRLFNKLFNQVNELQPDELDDEFVYQSTITYSDYLGMMKHIKDEQLNCASLNKIENILSNWMSAAVVRRPMHTSFFSNLWLSSSSILPHGSGALPLGHYGTGTLHLHLLMVLFIVGLTAWIFRFVAGIRSWKSLPLSFVLVGFIEFCMHKNELNLNHRLNLVRCKNPSWIARMASLVNYDYDSCRADTASAATSIPNIAFTGVEYLSELVLQPIVHLGEKVGRALQSYLNSFSGFNYLLAPLFPFIATLAIFVGLPFVMYLIARGGQRTGYRQTDHRAVQPPKRPRISNSSGNHQRAGAIR